MELVLSGRDIPKGSKLQGAKNYAIWSFKVRTVLQGERVWHIVDPNTIVQTSEASSSAHTTASGSGESATTAGATATNKDKETHTFSNNTSSH
jgi:hypothetical protein